jgi:catechol 2,3-dioxygenase-like lactoylglutathione lyase family enzyme
MASPTIAFTMYPVTDVPRAVAFYRDALGLQQSGHDLAYWVEFDVGGGTFGVGNFEQVGTPGSAQALALEIADLDGLRASLAAHGIEASEPHDLGACRISAVRDPDGNTVWLHQSKPRP